MAGREGCQRRLPIDGLTKLVARGSRQCVAQETPADEVAAERLMICNLLWRHWPEGVPVSRRTSRARDRSSSPSPGPFSPCWRSRQGRPGQFKSACSRPRLSSSSRVEAVSAPVPEFQQRSETSLLVPSCCECPAVARSGADQFGPAAARAEGGGGSRSADVPPQRRSQTLPLAVTRSCWAMHRRESTHQTRPAPSTQTIGDTVQVIPAADGAATSPCDASAPALPV